MGKLHFYINMYLCNFEIYFYKHTLLLIFACINKQVKYKTQNIRKKRRGLTHKTIKYNIPIEKQRDVKKSEE